MCWSHQHIGGACARMYDNATGTLICESCPVYGTEAGVPGNEKGRVAARAARVIPAGIVAREGAVLPETPLQQPVGPAWTS